MATALLTERDLTPSLQQFMARSGGIVRMITRELTWFFSLNPLPTDDELRAEVLRLVEYYGMISEANAMIFMKRNRDEYIKTLVAGIDDELKLLVESLPDIVPANYFNPDQVNGTVDYLLEKTKSVETPAAAVAAVAASTNRLVANAGRQVVLTNVKRSGTSWVRVPGPGACAFCLMLASRGATYGAGTPLVTEARKYHRTDGERGRKEGEKFHDNCNCTVKEVFRNEKEPDFVKTLQEIWNQTGSLNSFRTYLRHNEITIT